jgi:hypothetical protein
MKYVGVVNHKAAKGGNMANFDPATRVYQANEPNVVYTTPDNQQVHILYGGQGAPDGPGHGHYIYNVVQDTQEFHRPPAG